MFSNESPCCLIHWGLWVLLLLLQRRCYKSYGLRHLIETIVSKRNLATRSNKEFDSKKCSQHSSTAVFAWSEESREEKYGNVRRCLLEGIWSCCLFGLWVSWCIRQLSIDRPKAKVAPLKRTIVAMFELIGAGIRITLYAVFGGRLGTVDGRSSFLLR